MVVQEYGLVIYKVGRLYLKANRVARGADF